MMATYDIKQMQWDVHWPWQQLIALLEITPMTAFGAFFITAFTRSNSGASKKFYCTFN